VKKQTTLQFLLTLFLDFSDFLFFPQSFTFPFSNQTSLVSFFFSFLVSMTKAIAITDSFVEALRFFTDVFFLLHIYRVKLDHKLARPEYIYGIYNY
jgi:hypothetical protein